MARKQKKYSQKPRKARGGIKARSARGEVARHWWPRRWLNAIESIMDSARLQRGRRYARAGQVLSMEEKVGKVVVRVQGSRSKPYKASIGLSPLRKSQWESVLDVLAGQAVFAAQLLAGEMPGDIEDAFAEAGVNLFPASSHDLVTDCSCPDWANPCKHVAAAYYILGDRFEEDPFLLFRLRGRTQDEILDGLRHRWAYQKGAEELDDAAIDESEGDKLETGFYAEELLLGFWKMGDILDDFSVNVKFPDIPLPVFRRLGEPDVIGYLPLEKLLEEAYAITSQAAMIIAYHGEGMSSSETSSDS